MPAVDLPSPCQSQAMPLEVNSIEESPPPAMSRRYSPWRRELGSVVAEMGYLKEAKGDAFICMYDPPAGAERQNCNRAADFRLFMDQGRFALVLVSIVVFQMIFILAAMRVG